MSALELARRLKRGLRRRLLGQETAPRPRLRPDGLLESDLWLDQPDAEAQIDRRLERGELGAEQAARLRHFIDHGYMTLQLDLEPELYEQLDADVDRVWRERPRDVAYAYHGLLTRFADGTADDRRPACRIADLHTASEAALSLYLERRIFDAVEQAFGEPAVATQSLYFQWGSQQALHRDPIYVQTLPASHLSAAWIALEDISPESGPLVYVPGSHRLPYYSFRPGEFLFDHSRFGQAELDAGLDWDRRHWQATGLEPQAFTPRRGEVLIWHHSLLHGGSTPSDPARTRKSFVVHFSTRRTMPRVLNSYRRFESGQATGSEVFASERLLEKDGCCGFASPLSVGRPAS